MEILQNMSSIDPNIIKLSLDKQFLEVVCERFDFSNPPFNPIALSNSLTTFREGMKGIGLAANQVGLNLRVVSIKGIDSCLFNPQIVHASEEKDVMEEGCLSFPGMVFKIKRSKSIRVRFTDALGNVQTQSYAGLTARCIQHEIDHLNGILFFNQTSLYHRMQGQRKFKNR